MPKAMTKSQIADHIAKKANIKKKLAIQILEEIAALAYKEAKNSFSLPGLGKLVLVQRKARMGRNPQTGESIKIPAKKIIKFRVSKAAKETVVGRTVFKKTRGGIGGGGSNLRPGGGGDD